MAKTNLVIIKNLTIREKLRIRRAERESAPEVCEVAGPSRGSKGRVTGRRVVRPPEKGFQDAMIGVNVRRVDGVAVGGGRGRGG